MSRSLKHELKAGQRQALAAWHLAFSGPLRTSEIAIRIGLRQRGTLYVMDNLCEILPIYQDDAGYWRILRIDDLTPELTQDSDNEA